MRSFMSGAMALVLSACVGAGPREAAPEAVDWVQYGLRVRAYDAAELEREYAAVSDLNRAMPSTETALRLALLLSDARSAHHDIDEALALIDDVATSLEAAPAEIEFALLMRGLLRELAARENALAEARSETQSLRDQLDALIALEQRLNEEEAEP